MKKNQKQKIQEKKNKKKKQNQPMAQDKQKKKTKKKKKTKMNPAAASIDNPRAAGPHVHIPPLRQTAASAPSRGISHPSNKARSVFFFLDIQCGSAAQRLSPDNKPSGRGVHQSTPRGRPNNPWLRRRRPYGLTGLKAFWKSNAEHDGFARYTKCVVRLLFHCFGN